MIRSVTGDILESSAEALVNTVNCVGVMGRGIALQFKQAFPDNFREYAAACRRGEVKPGRMVVFETGRANGPRYIFNFPTKRHWRGKSRIEDIEAGLNALVAEVQARGIRSIAIPPLGSGLGGLDWSTVRPKIERAFAGLPEVEVFLFDPVSSTSDIRNPQPTMKPKMTAGRAALVMLMSRYLEALLDPYISLLEVHKLLYFLQEAGEPLKLRYVKAHYGPYAENLRHVLLAVEGHLLAGYEDDGDAPEKSLMLVDGAVENATEFLLDFTETQESINRTTTLVEGFETPYGLELLATVHWVSRQNRLQTLESVIHEVHAWSERKRKFTPAQIGLAFDRLNSQGWLEKV